MTLPAPDLEPLRPRLLGLAYRMLADVHEAEDVVQDAMARWYDGDRSAIASPEGWMVTAVTRLAIDRLRRLATERRAYVGPWLPEPISIGPAADHDAEVGSELSIALMLLLERLGPEERAAFLLREVIGQEYTEIARTLERSEAAVRQMVHRARERVRTPHARFTVPTAERERLLERFLDALAAEDADALLALLAPDVEYVGDGGGVVRSARRRVVGANRVARLLLGIRHKSLIEADAYRRHDINGTPGYTIVKDGLPAAVFAVDFAADSIRGVYAILNPMKLRGFAEVRAIS